MISVIVPVYNMERFLRRCVDSILLQTYRDFELLLVDDGSTDSSGDICDDYAAGDARVLALHKENGGESDARNYGITHANGDYICIVDADDYVGRDYLRILMEMMEDYSADMTILCSTEVTDMELSFKKSEDRRFELTYEETFRKMMLVDEFGLTSWGKLYKKELFKEIRFPVGRIHDDMFTIPYVLERCVKCAYSTSVQHYYYQRPGSISHNLDDENILTWLEAAEKIAEHTKEHHVSLYPYAQSYYVKFLLWGIVDRLLERKDYGNWCKRIREESGKYLKKAAILPGLKFRQKMKAYVFLLNAGLYRRLRRKFF